MENGSTPRSETNGAAAQNGHLPLSARLLGVGARGAGIVTKATGIDKAVEVAAEEAIVAAVESEAVERAMARVLQGPIVEEAVQGALESDAVKRAVLEAMDSELVDEVWRRLLASEEAQQLVERIAGAPEVRAAISAQGVGLLEDIGRTIGKLTRGLDDSFERIARRIFFRKPRAGADQPRRLRQPRPRLPDRRDLRQPRLHRLRRPGDAGRQHLRRQRQRRHQLRDRGRLDHLGRDRLALPGQLLVAGRADAGDALRRHRAQLPAACRRAAASGACSASTSRSFTFGIGFLGIVFREERRGWEDRFSGTRRDLRRAPPRAGALVGAAAGVIAEADVAEPPPTVAADAVEAAEAAPQLDA